MPSERSLRRRSRLLLALPPSRLGRDVRRPGELQLCCVVACRRLASNRLRAIPGNIQG